MSKHTPGEWQLDLGKLGSKGKVYSDNGSTIADVAVFSFGKEQSEANARLIASAPELLEACKLAEDYMNSINNEGELADKTWKAIRQAIAKTEGRI